MLNIGSLIASGLDYIMIVDKNYRIVYNTRYDEKINEETGEYLSSDVLNKYYFDIYPKLSPEQSSVVRCIQTKQAVVNKRQVYYDYVERRYVTNNVTLPLMRRGELVAAVELAMDAGVGEPEDGAIPSDRKFDDFVYRLRKDAGLITFDTILTANKAMQASIEKAKILTGLPNPTLIYGETGTGKELFAQSMITYSQTPKEKVVIQNCAAVPENLMESILFGTVRGIYTGAETKKGLFEQADGGVLFLDELNSIPYQVQGKLLRVLQDGTFRPLGASRDKRVNVKIIAAMNIDPMEAIDKQVLRSDLFYRFSGGLITLPPLRERKEDIALFLDYYTDYFGRVYGKTAAGISGRVRQLFMNYSFPGNVRELRNAIETMLISLDDGELLEEKHMSAYMLEQIRKEQQEKAQRTADGEFAQASGDGAGVSGILRGNAPGEAGLDADCCCPPELLALEANAVGRIDYQGIMENVERCMLAKALEMAGGNKSRASEIPGLPRQTFKYKLEKLGIE